MNHSYKIVSNSSNYIAVMFHITEEGQRLLKKSLLVISAVMETGKAVGLVQQVPYIPSREPWIKQQISHLFLIHTSFPQNVLHFPLNMGKAESC